MSNKSIINMSSFRINFKAQIKQKYFDLFCSKIIIKGDLTPEQKHYILWKMYENGTLCCTKDVINKPLFCEYSYENKLSHYGLPVNVRYINNENITGLFPDSMTGVNLVDCVIGYVRPKHNYSIKNIVDFYAEQLTDLAVIIKINELMQKMPFLIAVSPSDKKAMETLINKLFSDDPAIFTTINEIENLKNFTGTPFNIDKLRAEYETRENALKTQLGLDNNNNIKKERMITDEVNANNDEIETSSNVYIDELNAFAENIKKVLGFNISFEWASSLSNTPLEDKDANKNMEDEEDDTL